VSLWAKSNPNSDSIPLGLEHIILQYKGFVKLAKAETLILVVIQHYRTQSNITALYNPPATNTLDLRPRPDALAQSKEPHIDRSLTLNFVGD
jgi:hypothetical protein